MPKDRFEQPFFYPSKSGGFFYEMSDNPKNDNEVDWPSGGEMTFSGSIATMHPRGPTDFGIGKNISSFNDSIGGCNMDFKATAKRGYAFKADDARDIEYKCLMKASGISSGNGFSISFCTGHHTSSSCCQGFAYMNTIEITENPSTFRFRKETVHVEYTESPEGAFTHPKCNFRINGLGRFVGIGACRYNKPSTGGTSPQDDTVILEVWFNPDPDNDPSDWTMLKRIEDKPGKGWTGSKGKCNGDNDQIGPWSGAQSRMKTNSTAGTIQFKSVTLREINPFGTFEEPDPGGGGGTAVQRSIYYAMIAGDPPTYSHFTNVTGHEICETLTDPDPLDTFGGQAWGNSTGAEISDPCEDISAQYASGLDAEAYWSNSDDKCVIPGLTIADTVEVPSMTNRGGGEVIANGKIYLIYWGLDWSTRATTPVAATLTDKIQNKLLGTNVTYFSKLTQYGCSAPTWGGAVFNTTFPVPTRSSNVINELEGRACIVDTFNKGLLPIPTVTNDDVYILYVPVGKEISPLGVESTPGGFHDTWNPFLTPFVAPCPTGFHRGTSGACIPDTVTCPAGQHEENGICIDNEVPSGDPSPPQKVIGTFTLYRDINIYRTDACEGSTGGGGDVGGGGDPGGGASTFYSLAEADIDADKEIANVSSQPIDGRTRVAEKITSSSSAMKGKILKQFDIFLKKNGTPGATPTIKAKIWNSSNAVMYTSPTEIDPTTLTTSFTIHSFDFAANTYVLQLNDRVGVEYLGTSSSNYIQVGYKEVSSGGNERQSQYESGTWDDKTTRDLVCTMWQ